MSTEEARALNIGQVATQRCQLTRGWPPPADWERFPNFTHYWIDRNGTLFVAEGSHERSAEQILAANRCTSNLYPEQSLIAEYGIIRVYMPEALTYIEVPERISDRQMIALERVAYHPNVRRIAWQMLNRDGRKIREGNDLYSLTEVYARGMTESEPFGPSEPETYPEGAVHVGGCAVPVRAFAFEPMIPSSQLISDYGYLYHATNLDNAYEIAVGGLVTHKPSYGTDQQTWPDGSTEKRSYFSKNAGLAWRFAPVYGRSVILRVKEDPALFRLESTGDVYTTKRIPPWSIEIMDSTGSWRAITDLVAPETPEVLGSVMPGSAEMDATVAAFDRRVAAFGRALTMPGGEDVYTADNPEALDSPMTAAGQTNESFATLAALRREKLAELTPEAIQDRAPNLRYYYPDDARVQQELEAFQADTARRWKEVEDITARMRAARQREQGEARADTQLPAIPGESPEDWISGIDARPGIVIDPGLARSRPCLRINLGPGRKPMIFQKGIIGGLDEDQVALYCQEGFTEHQATEAQLQRIATMSEAAHTCTEQTKALEGTPQHLEAYFTCLSEKLHSKGVAPV